MKKYKAIYPVIAVAAMLILALLFLFGCDDKLCQKIIKIVAQNALTNLEYVIYSTCRK